MALNSWLSPSQERNQSLCKSEMLLVSAAACFYVFYRKTFTWALEQKEKKSYKCSQVLKRTLQSSPHGCRQQNILISLTCLCRAAPIQPWKKKKKNARKLYFGLVNKHTPAQALSRLHCSGLLHKGIERHAVSGKNAKQRGEGWGGQLLCGTRPVDHTCLLRACVKL